MAEPELVPLKSVGERWSVSQSTLRRWSREGRIHLIRLPAGTLRMSEEELRRIERGQDAA